MSLHRRLLKCRGGTGTHMVIKKKTSQNCNQINVAKVVEALNMLIILLCM